jgi:hypothetical protein
VTDIVVLICFGRFWHPSCFYLDQAPRYDRPMSGGAGDQSCLWGLSMRTFADSTGIEWTVYEVKRQGATADRWSYLPAEFGDGWLCFESDVSKRRLTPVPPRWREFSDSELERSLEQAAAVNRPRIGAEERPRAE